MLLLELLLLLLPRSLFNITTKAVVKTRAAAEAAAPAAAFVLISSWFMMVSDWFLTGLSWFLTGFLTGQGGHYGIRPYTAIYGDDMQTLNSRLPLEQSSHRHETSAKHGSDDSQRFIFRHRKKMSGEISR